MLTQTSHDSVSAQRESNNSAVFFLSVADALVLERDWVITVFKVVCIHSSWVAQEMYYDPWLVCCFETVLSTARFALGKEP